MIEEDNKDHQSVMGLVIDACKRWEEVKGQDGQTYRELVIDTKRAHLKTLDVASNQFGFTVGTVEDFEMLAEMCFHHMSAPRAAEIADRVRGFAAIDRYIWDGKGSESQRDRNNAKMTFFDKMNKNKSEHVYTVKEDGKRTLMDGILGRKVESDSEKD